MLVLSHLHQLFNVTTYYAYLHTLRCRGYAALLNRSRAESAIDRPLKLRHRLS